MRTSSIVVTWPSHRILLSRITFSRRVCPFVFRTVLYLWLCSSRRYQECLWATCGGNVTVRGHTSASQRRVDRVSASYSLRFDCWLMCLFLQSFFILPNVADVAVVGVVIRCHCYYYNHLRRLHRHRIVIIVISIINHHNFVCSRQFLLTVVNGARTTWVTERTNKQANDNNRFHIILRAIDIWDDTASA